MAYLLGVFAGGFYYGIRDIGWAAFGKGGVGFLTGAKSYVMIFAYQYTGTMDGASDAIFGADE
jgi:hypothetical protein